MSHVRGSRRDHLNVIGAASHQRDDSMDLLGLSGRVELRVFTRRTDGPVLPTSSTPSLPPPRQSRSQWNGHRPSSVSSLPSGARHRRMLSHSPRIRCAASCKQRQLTTAAVSSRVCLSLSRARASGPLRHVGGERAGHRHKGAARRATATGPEKRPESAIRKQGKKRRGKARQPVAVEGTKRKERSKPCVCARIVQSAQGCEREKERERERERTREREKWRFTPSLSLSLCLSSHTYHSLSQCALLAAVYRNATAGRRWIPPLPNT